VRRFFFAPDSPRIAALMRIGIGLVLGYDAMRHWPFVIELYSTAGLPRPVFPDTFLAPPALTPVAAVGLHSLLIFATVAVTLGWWTRLSLWVTLALTLWFGLLDLPSTFAKYVVLAAHLLLLLSFSGCGNYWSVDAWITGQNRESCRLSPVWPRRLVQLLICSVYLGAAVTKLRTPEFSTGELLTFSLLDEHFGGYGWARSLAFHPHAMTFLSIATVAFELVFPFLIWVRKARLVMWGLAMLFHAALGVMLHLGYFSPLMFVLLLAFLEEHDLQRLGWFRRTSVRELRPNSHSAWKRGGISLIAWSLIAGVAVGGGISLQRTIDWYGVFRPRTPRALPEVDPADAVMMLVVQGPQEADYFHRIDLGSRVSGNQVFGADAVFRPGMTVFVLAHLIRPHPALTIEGVLIGPEGAELARFEHRAGEHVSYVVRGFELTPGLPAGTYRILMQANGYEVGQKSFELRVPAAMQSGRQARMECSCSGWCGTPFAVAIPSPYTDQQSE